MRRLSSIAIAGFALATAAGCGSGDPPRHARYTTIDRARAHVVAHLLAIREADLPEFKVTASPAVAPQSHPQDDARLATCIRPPAAKPSSSARKAKIARQTRADDRGSASHRSRRSSAQGNRPSAARDNRRGATLPHAWASAHSRELSADSSVYHQLGASSTAWVMPSAAAAQLLVAATRNLDRTCFERALRARHALAHGHSSIRGVVVEPLPLKVKGVDASVAYETVVGLHPPLVMYGDWTFFSYGQDVFLLHTFHSSTPVPPAMDERLLGLLLARAKSHSR